MAKTERDAFYTGGVLHAIINIWNIRYIFIACCLITCFVIYEYGSDDGLIFRRLYSVTISKRKIAKQKACDELFLKHMTTISKLDVDKRRGRKRLPDVIGIGAKKCGTATLNTVISAHPMIFTSTRETHYFESNLYDKGLDYYRNILPKVTDYELLYEFTPEYFNFDLDVPKRIRHDVPNAKLTLVLCDPVNRTLSEFVQINQDSLENMSFDALITSELSEIESVKRYTDDNEAMHNYLDDLNPRSRLLSTGMYYYHLERWLKSFNLSDIFIVNGEELMTDPGSVIEKIQDFLDIPRLVIKEDFIKGPSSFYGAETREVETINNVSFVVRSPPFFLPLQDRGNKTNDNWDLTLSDETKRKLREFYDPFNVRLYKLLGKNFNWQRP